MKINKLSPLASVFGAVMLATGAQAAFLSGSIDIGAFGSNVVIDKTANSVTFVDTNAGWAGNAVVSNATGDLAGLFGDNALYVDFDYSPLAVANPLWTVLGGPPTATFSLLSITFIDEVTPGLILTGKGTMNLTGFDPTPGNWSFSADTAGGLFTFSSQTVARTPDGGTSIALLGFSLLGLIGARRKFAKA
jgi:hypothetical protein